MNLEQYEKVRMQGPAPSVISINQLTNRTPRTLIYGYYSDGTTHHVYLGPDGLIHTLLYKDIAGGEPSDESQRFLILHHAAGIAGGVNENLEYIPGKRSYPESCDFEFCELLALAGVNLNFTTFNGKYDEARRAQHGLYAGYTFEDGGIEVTSLTMRLVEETALLQDAVSAEIAARVLVETCRQEKVHFIASEYTPAVRVDVTKADWVLAKAIVLCGCLPKSLLSDPDLVNKLCKTVFGVGLGVGLGDGRRGGYGKEFRTETDAPCTSGGEFYFSVLGAPTIFNVQGDAEFYVPQNEGQNWPQAVTGFYKGHRYIAILKDDTGHAHIRLIQFGDSKRILKILENLYKLKPAPRAVSF